MDKFNVIKASDIYSKDEVDSKISNLTSQIDKVDDKLSFNKCVQSQSGASHNLTAYIGAEPNQVVVYYVNCMSSNPSSSSAVIAKTSNASSKGYALWGHLDIMSYDTYNSETKTFNGDYFKVNTVLAESSNTKGGSITGNLIVVGLNS